MNHSQPRRRIVRLAAVAALLALVATPMLHGPHPQHVPSASAQEAPAFDPGALREASACPVCAALAQTRATLLATPHTAIARFAFRPLPILASPVGLPCASERGASGPRAPPCPLSSSV